MISRKRWNRRHFRRKFMLKKSRLFDPLSTTATSSPSASKRKDNIFLPLAVNLSRSNVALESNNRNLVQYFILLYRP
jgi:hypothetical protein